MNTCTFVSTDIYKFNFKRGFNDGLSGIAMTPVRYTPKHRTRTPEQKAYAEGNEVGKRCRKVLLEERYTHATVAS